MVAEIGMREEVTCIKYIKMWMVVDIEYEFRVRGVRRIVKYWY
jgi:hypothetical protein